MIRRIVLGILGFFFLAPPPAKAQGIYSIYDIKETSAERWCAEFQTREGKTVIVDAPVHIPDLDAVPLMRVCKNFKTYELVGDESFLIGKADARKREEIYDPDQFPDTEYTYRVTALGSMYYVKNGKTFNRKNSFPASVADTTKPWNHDQTTGYRMIATQRIGGLPVFLSGTVAIGMNSMQTFSSLTYIDSEHYSMNLNTVTIEEILSPDMELLSFHNIQEILTERIVDGKLQEILEINLGYLCMSGNAAEQNDELSWQLIPVWQIRGYDTYLDPVHVLSMLSEEDRIKYDPDMIYSIYINAVTGELIPTVPVV